MFRRNSRKGFPYGRQMFRRQRLEAGELDSLTVFAAYAGALQLADPFGLTAALPAAGDRGVGGLMLCSFKAFKDFL